MLITPLRTALALILALSVLGGCTTTKAQNSAMLGALAGSTLGGADLQE